MMSTKKKGLLTVSGEWRVHLRDWKKIFWRKERVAEEKEIKEQLDAVDLAADSLRRKVEIFVENNWGERCEEHDPNCSVCEAWMMVDFLFGIDRDIPFKISSDTHGITDYNYVVKDSMEMRNRIVNWVFKWIEEKRAVAGEVIMQDDDCIISAPSMLSEIVDDIIKPDFCGGCINVDAMRRLQNSTRLPCLLCNKHWRSVE